MFGENFILIQQNSQVSWTEAESFCQNQYQTNLASLVTVSDEELSEIASLCGGSNVNNINKCWIGASMTNGFGTWSDGNDYDKSTPN